MHRSRTLGSLAVVLLVMLTSCGDSNGGGGGVPPETPPPLADLTITFATVERVLDQSCFGSEICLIVTVANRGARNATGLDDGCGTSSFGDPQPWSSFVIGGSVAATSSVTFRSGYDNLAPHLPATFTLFCEVDAANRVAESSEANNTYTTTLSL